MTNLKVVMMKLKLSLCVACGKVIETAVPGPVIMMLVACKLACSFACLFELPFGSPVKREQKNCLLFVCRETYSLARFVSQRRHL